MQPLSSERPTWTPVEKPAGAHQPVRGHLLMAFHMRTGVDLGNVAYMLQRYRLFLTAYADPAPGQPPTELSCVHSGVGEDRRLHLLQCTWTLRPETGLA